MRKHLGAAEGVERQEALPVPTDSDTGRNADDLRDRQWLQYLDILASEDDPVVPQMYPLISRAAEILDAAATRPQTDKIIALTIQIRAMNPQQQGADMQRALEALQTELAKRDAVLWAEIEADDDDFWGKIGTSFDSPYG